MMSESIPEGFFPPLDAMQLRDCAIDILTNRNKRLNSRIAELEAENERLRKYLSS